MKASQSMLAALVGFSIAGCCATGKCPLANCCLCCKKPAACSTSACSPASEHTATESVQHTTAAKPSANHSPAEHAIEPTAASTIEPAQVKKTAAPTTESSSPSTGASTAPKSSTDHAVPTAAPLKPTLPKPDGSASAPPPPPPLSIEDGVVKTKALATDGISVVAAKGPSLSTPSSKAPPESAPSIYSEPKQSLGRTPAPVSPTLASLPDKANPVAPPSIVKEKAPSATSAPATAEPAKTVATKIPVATPASAPAGNAFAHAKDYSWLQGKLVRIHSRGGHWQVRYAPLDQQDEHGGMVVLTGAVDADMKEGDIVKVAGSLAGYDDRLRATLYRNASLKVVDRPDAMLGN